MTDQLSQPEESTRDPLHWHTLQTGEVLRNLSVSEEGLSEAEAKKRLSVTGPNTLPKSRKRGPIQRFLVQFHNVLIYVLLAAAGVTALLGHWLDTGVILGVVVINAFIGFIQEGKAEKALESLQKMLSLKATVIREGKKREIPAQDLVPGDIITFASGDKIPADVRLVRSKNLKVEESTLTGESESVEKSVEPVEEESALGDRRCMAFSSTLVSYGSGTGVVVATGSKTEIGKINQMLADVEQLTTPLLRQVARFGRFLTLIILGLSFLTFIFGFLIRGDEPAALFLAVVALAVAAIPEGLPAILTIALAIGVQRMAGRNAIIRRLPAVETLGSVSVIFTDKTGTLTRNEMTAKQIVTTDGVFQVGGNGYRPEGTIRMGSAEASLDQFPILRNLLRVGVSCNEARIFEREAGSWDLHGDPTEGALMTLGLKAGYKKEDLNRELPQIDDIPFESERRYMATLHRAEGGDTVVFVKGGPEKMLSLCEKQARGGATEALDRAFWKEKSEETAREGQRVLGLAMKELPASVPELNEADIESELVFLGFVGIYDPPREEAVEAVRKCRTAGIQVKMVTGDHALTAMAIGRELGLAEESDRPVTGSQLEKTSDSDLDRLVPTTSVFARVNPEHKLRLVSAMQKNNHIVAMTGDGVNDAPALKRADVGVAMGIKGTEVSKDSAEMVLTDDNFASITNAVEEGRTVYDNLRKSILFLLPTNGGQASVIVFAILFGLTSPFTPVQVLWVNMITAVTLALALAFEPPEHRVMRRKPRDPSEPLLTLFFAWRILFVSLLLLVSALGLFFWEQTVQGTELEIARTAAVNMIFFGQAFYLFNSRFITGSSLTPRIFTGNRYVWIALATLVGLQLVYTYAPFMQVLFETGPLPASTWGVILAAGFLIFFLVEIEKRVVRGWNGDN